MSFQAGKDLVFVQGKDAGHADWKTTLDIYTQHSGRGIDPKIRQLLTEFLGEPTDAPDAKRERVTYAGHARLDVL